MISKVMAGEFRFDQVTSGYVKLVQNKSCFFRLRQVMSG